jgi:hypothetical protein
MRIKHTGGRRSAYARESGRDPRPSVSLLSSVTIPPRPVSLMVCRGVGQPGHCAGCPPASPAAAQAGRSGSPAARRRAAREQPATVTANRTHWQSRSRRTLPSSLPCLPPCYGGPPRADPEPLRARDHPTHLGEGPLAGVGGPCRGLDRSFLLFHCF